MSAQADGTIVCDRCGASVGNGSVFNAVVVADRTDDQQVLNLHFCRPATDATPDTQDCARKILSKANVKHRLENGLGTGVATPA